MAGEIAKYEPGRALVEQAIGNVESVKDLDALNTIQDKAAAMREASRQARQPKIVWNYFMATAIIARWQIGKLLPDSGIGKGIKSFTLKDLNIDEMESHRWQLLARIPKASLKDHIAKHGDPIQDQQEGTDLIILGGPQRIACRVRRPEFYPSYRFDFTIRSKRMSGAKTEWSKLMSEDESWRHVYIYAFSTKDDIISSYHIIDIPSFREYARYLKPIEMDNHDGTFFYAFDVRRMPPQVVIFTTETEQGSILDKFKDESRGKESDADRLKREAIEKKPMRLISDDELDILAAHYHVKHGRMEW